MISDFYFIFSWWFLVFGLGIIFLPLTWFFFRKFFDLGYPFAKIMALLSVCYFVWLAGSLHLLSFTLSTIFFIIFAFIIFNLCLARKFKKEFFVDLKKTWKILLFEEIMFFIALTSWSFIRGFQPNIEGLEKFMDFGFVNSILRSQYFPPADMWMAGKTINYYYFGHLVTAVLTKLSGIDSAITYNLMIATIFALAFTATFSIGANLASFATRKESQITNYKLLITAGLLSAFLLTLGGNLHPLWWFLTNNFAFAGYWYPDATRFIVEKFGAMDNTIHEFPIYSFVVSDLHGHVSNIPFVLLFLALLFAWLSSHRDKTLITNYYLLITSLVLAVMYMTNSWDFPIYFLVLGATILWLNYQKYGLTFQLVYKSLLFTIYYLLFTILFSLPFHLHFSPIAQGLDFVHAHSPFWQLLVLWGYQWIIGASFLVFIVFRKIQNTKYKIQNTDTFIIILFVVATFLIILPEIIYVKDIYITSYHRANTMFKLVYQSFMLYALASGYLTIRLWLELKRKFLKFILYTLYFILYTFVLVYPYFAIHSYYNDLKTYRRLYGLKFLQETSPDDYAGILWLNQNIKGQPMVLEAAGDSYTNFNRVSAMTGLPTVQGWLVHEWLWRGGFGEPGKRAEEVEKIFESPDLNLTKSLLKRYQVQYVFLGSKEKEKYQTFEEKFSRLGKVIFVQGNTKIYSLEKLNSQ